MIHAALFVASFLFLAVAGLIAINVAFLGFVGACNVLSLFFTGCWKELRTDFETGKLKKSLVAMVGIWVGTVILTLLICWLA